MRDPATPILAFAFAVLVAFVAFVVGLNVAWRAPPSLEQWMQNQDLGLREAYGPRIKNVKFSRNYYDADGDCQDTRAEVLIKHSLKPVTFKDTGNCVVERGYWIDPYDGIHYDNADDLEIDHRVSVREATRSGRAVWDKKKWKDFYNDRDNLVPIGASLNQSKGDSGPGTGMWEPEHGKADFARKWIHVKRKWGLSVDRKEAHEVRDLLAR